MTSNKIHLSDLVPNYHHGIIDPALKEDFENELAQNAELQQELDDFKQFEELYKTIDNDIPEPPPELFDKILASIDEVEEEKATDAPLQSRYKQVEYRPSLATILAKIWSKIKESTSIPWTLAAVQAIALVLFLMPSTPQNNYQTLSNNSAVQMVSQQATHNIVFEPTTTESEIREFLLNVEGTIVSGPTAEGRYKIALPQIYTSEEKIRSLRETDTIIFIEKYSE